ncbi:MAG: hypothetical protein ISS57_19050 [Anaerolineales bacterium]|nr:hypothetical protein [Anaerolineales bacterium]
MSDINSKRQQFQERLDGIAGSRKLLAGSESDLDFEMLEPLQAWETRLDSLLAEFRGELEHKPVPKAEIHLPKPRHRPYSRPDATLVEWLQDTDNMMLVELELGKHPLPLGFQGGYEIVDSEEAMKKTISHACGLEQVPTGVQWKDYHLGVFHIPNRSTLINPSHYEKKYGKNGLHNHNQRALAHVISDVAMERWGWGFLLEYTSLGRRAGASGLWPAMLAYRARLPYGDQRDIELAQAIHNKWILLKTGWMDWIWQYVMFKAHRPVGEWADHPRPGRMFELLMKFQTLFPLRIYPFGVKVSVRKLVDLVKFIFLEQTEVAPTVSNQIILQLQELSIKHDEKARELVKLPLSRIFGRLYFSWLENQIGILSTPYAALIAAHEPHIDLASISAAQFLEYVEKEPRHNPDARLAMLSKLDARVKYNPRSMFTAAWERLKLEGPREYFEL